MSQNFLEARRQNKFKKELDKFMEDKSNWDY